LKFEELNIKRMRKLSVALLALCLTLSIQAQVPNNTCITAIPLNNLVSWCSGPGAFTNAGASVSGVLNPLCFPADMSGDVWFRFVANTTDINISVIGAVPLTPGGTLQNPQFALYEGDCGNLIQVQCSSDNFNNQVVEAFAGPLNIGATYYLRVDARNANQGTFQLCLNAFNAVPQPSSDCPTGVVLCDKSPFNVPQLLGAGLLTNEISPGSCIGQEFSSAWYKWTCDEPGSLTFTLTPTNPTDDLDFMVFELPNGIEDCTDKIPLRCMASGENVGAPYANWAPCTGPTGLNEESTDLQENPGCQPGNDNFLAALQMESGKSYALIVNNFSNSGNGFSVSFGGTGTFLGPKTEVSIDPAEGSQCDLDELLFSDITAVPPGFNATLNWVFGGGAQPATATGSGEHIVSYSSFGTKSVVLTIETDAGCKITEVRTIFIEPCCHPDTVLQTNLLDLQHPICYGESSGHMEVGTFGGTPPYQYSLDGQVFQNSGLYGELPGGDYQVGVYDAKGCYDSLPVSLLDPPPLLVDAGSDQRIDLGYSAVLQGLINSPNGPYVSAWAPLGLGGLDCAECISVEVWPTSTTTYYLSAVDELGCRSQDSVRVTVDLLRPIFIPNVFSPNGDGANDYFTAYAGPAAVSIQVMRVFDRWGGLMFETRNQGLGDDAAGWDGTYRGRPVNPGVYVYMIEILFADGVVGLYKGDVTVLR
jgi:gliding motility-associated-like protein